MVLANQRYVLAERHAQRKFLVHSLHSLNSLISDTFSITSNNLDNWFCQIRRCVLNFSVKYSFLIEPLMIKKLQSNFIFIIIIIYLFYRNESYIEFYTL